ncbi:MAG: hypothetical protein C4554_05670 [Dethiobacter sp.]|jgi:hypothetical protein|nr:MAG: hypothetical protein C4554_05670 [Dethiobacter sp.]
MSFLEINFSIKTLKNQGAEARFVITGHLRFLRLCREFKCVFLLMAGVSWILENIKFKCQRILQQGELKDAR